MSGFQEGDNSQVDGKPAKPRRQPRRNRRWPGWPLWMFLALVAVVIGGLQWIGPSWDRAIANLITQSLVAVSAMAVLCWFTFRSAYSKSVRFGVLFLLLVGIVGIVVAFEIEGTSGNLTFALRNRWRPRPDELLAQPEATDKKARLNVTTPDDFPGFLGPNRSNKLAVKMIADDWSMPPKVLWRQPIGAGWSGFSAVNGYGVTMEQRGDQELVTCYEIETGALVWSHSVTARHETLIGGIGPRSTPTIAGGRVFALGGTGILRCLDGNSGRLLWSHDLLEMTGSDPVQDLKTIAWGRAASPLVVDQKVIVPVGGPPGGPFVSLAAWNVTDGTLVWKAGDDQVSYSSPTLCRLLGKQQILSVNEKTLTSHDPESGKVLWSYDWPGNSNADTNASQAHAVSNNRVLVSKAYSGGGALIEVSSSEDGTYAVETIWHKVSVLKTKFTNVVVHDDLVFALSDGIMECVQLETGKRLWKERGRGKWGHGQILGVGEVILVQTEEGSIVMIAAGDQFQLLGRFPALDTKTWNNLCLYGKLLLARNAEEVVCLKLP